jgi:hypothetical protein
MTTPELSIRFHKPTIHIYEPGNTVSGSAFFVPLFNAKLRSLVVSLQGYCYTSSLGANNKVSHVVPFLHLSTSTLDETYTYIGERYEAPFSFVFPERTDVEHEAGPERLKSLFNQGPQPLPSSVVVSARNCVQTVRYVIEVEVYGRKRAVCEESVLFRQRTRTLSESDRSIKEALSIKEAQVEKTRLVEDLITFDGEDDNPCELRSSPTSPLLSDTWRSDNAVYYNRPETIRISDEDDAPKLSLHALPMVSTHHKGAVDRFKHARNQNKGPLQWVFKPWKTPKIVFMPSIYCPQIIAVGQEIPLLLSVDTIKNPVWHGVGDENRFVLEEFSLAVTAHNRTIMQNRPHKRRWGRCLELSYAVLQATGLSAPISTDGVPTPFVQNFKILPGTIPSFATYTMSRGYSIDVFFKFRFGEEALEWGASLNLNVTAGDLVPPVDGANMDPLLFVDPRREPQYFWRSHIEAGAAESTSRSNIYPDKPSDDVNLPSRQWQTGHGRLPRTSFACASGQVRPELTPVKAVRGKGNAFNVVAGVCGKPYRRYLKDLEPMVAPLLTFKHGLGLDGPWEERLKEQGQGRVICIDGCGVLKSDTKQATILLDCSFVN